MFKNIKFQIILPYNEDILIRNASVLKNMGVKIEDVRRSDILDENDNKIGDVGIFVCIASNRAYKVLTKVFDNEKTYEGLPTLY